MEHLCENKKSESGADNKDKKGLIGLSYFWIFLENQISNPDFLTQPDSFF